MDDRILDEGFRIKTPKDELEIRDLESKNSVNSLFMQLGQLSFYLTVLIFIIAFSSHAAAVDIPGLGEGGQIKTGALTFLFVVLLVYSYIKPLSVFVLGFSSHVYIILYQMIFLRMPFAGLILIKLILVFLLGLAIYGYFYYEKNKKRIAILKGT